uniref:Uncharacterized protein n=1 Tax=Acrobeloides nanus TaxID=290746 RepID=A0A914CW78_9BILA
MSVQVEKPAEAHIQYIRDAYDRLNEYTLVKKAKSGYDKTKHSFGLLEKTLNYIEGTAYSATNNIAIPAYENYGYPVTDRLLNLYSRGAENTKTAVDTTKNVAVTTGTVGLGLAIVSAQVGLNASIFGANLLLDTALFTKSVGGSAINSALDLEKTVEQRIYLVLERSQKYAQVPADKIAEHANSFLDIANAVFDRLIGLPAEYEDPNSTVGQRVSRLTKRVISGLSARAHNDVIDPASQKIRYFAGQLNQKLALADLVRQRRDWAFEKYGLVTSSVSDLRDKVENQAGQLNIRPEKMLLDSIRRTSTKLSENMEKFRNKSSKLLNGGAISSQIEAATSYIQHLVSTFSEANDIYQIKDEVLDEAQHRLTEVAQLVSSPFLRHSSVSVDSTSTDDGPILNSSGENSPVDNSPLSSDSDEE